MLGRFNKVWKVLFKGVKQKPPRRSLIDSRRVLLNSVEVGI